MLQPRCLILMYECVYVGVMGGGGRIASLTFIRIMIISNWLKIQPIQKFRFL